MSGARCPEGYEFSADPSRLDPAWIHETLASHAYWAIGRPRATQDAANAGSRCYGVYAVGARRQVAFARVVTDSVTFAWLSDVVVDPQHRGRGLGTALVQGILADLEPLGLRRVVLRSAPGAGSLYERLGWEPLDEPETWRERRPSPVEP